MKKQMFSLLVLSSVVCFVSCKKENPLDQSANPLTGNWKFISMNAITEGSVTVTDGSTVEKSVSTSNYTTINNGGTVTITAISFSATGLTYTVDDLAHSYYYSNSQLVDSFSVPFNFTLPPSSSVSNYTLVGQDSLSFSGQGLFSSQGSTTTTGASGSKFTINGNILTMTSRVVKDSSSTDSGAQELIHQAASVIVKMEKL